MTASRDLVIRGALVYDHEGDTDRPPRADVRIAAGRIAEIGDGIATAGARTIDADGKLLIPGFVNAHYHSHDILLRGCFENLPTEIWFTYALPPAYPQRSAEEVRARTLLAAAEAIRNGVTTLQDMLTIAPLDPELLDVALEAYDEAGLRVVMAQQIADLRALDRVPFWRECVPAARRRWLTAAADSRAAGGADPVEAVIETCLARRGRHHRIGWALGPTNPLLCSPDMMRRLAAFSATHELPVVTHFYQSRAEILASRRLMAAHGGSLVGLLEEVGLLNERLALAHGIWTLGREAAALAAAGATIVLNIASNMKSKGGIPPLRDFIDAGVALALGSDNSGCSDSQNMFQQMKLVAGLAAVGEPEPGPPTAADTVRYATEGGARALGLGGEVGAIRVGARADLVLLDLRTTAFVPLNSAARQMVFAESGAAIDTVIVDGRILMAGRTLESIDEDALYRAVERVMPGLRRDLDAIAARNESIAPHLLDAYRKSWRVDVGMNRYLERHRGRRTVS